MAELHYLYDSRQLSLSTLAADTPLVSITKIDANRVQGFRVIKVKGWADILGKTEGDGPLIFGMACNSLSATKIKAAFDADPADGSANNMATQAEADVPIFVLGMWSRTNAHCKPISFEKTINWSIIEGRSFDFFVLNMGAQLNDGATMETFAKFTGVWLRD